MADFLLSVGVDVGLSYEQMQTDIGTLVAKLNENPQRVRVGLEIDQAAIDKFRTEVANIHNALGGIGKVTVNPVGGQDVGAQSAKSQKAVKILAENTKEYYNALKQTRTLLEQVRHSQEQWSKAKNGTSKDAYDSLTIYAGELEKLISTLEKGETTQEDFNTKIASLRDSIKTANNQIAGAHENTKIWTERVGALSTKFGEWFTITRVIMAIVRAMKQMVTEVINLDTAMTELKKVTNETDATYDKFLDTAVQRAKKLGATVTDVVKTSADAARLGLSMEDAEYLVDAALVYKNIGDDIQDVDQASASLISIMQAFGIEAKDVMSIVDKLNITGNKFAISSGGVGDALLNSASALQAAGNTLEQSIGLITAANTTIQNPDSVGTALKTISMYLRAAKTEAEEAGESTEGMANSVSELRDELLSLTGNKVDIQIDENTFKSTYDILKELSAVWDELSDVSRANITELIGGKRNSNVISALLKDFEIAEKSISTMSGAAGTALEENAKVVESIQGRISKLKTEFADFARSLINSDIVKMAVDFGSAALSTLTAVVSLIDKLGGLKTALMALSAVFLIAKGGLVAYKVQLIATAAADRIIKFLDALESGMYRVVMIIPDAIAAWKSYKANVVSASTAMQATIPVIGLLLAGVTLVIAAISNAKNNAEELTDSVDSGTESFKHLGQAAQQESEHIIDLTSSYLEASYALQTLTGTMDTYDSARDELIDGLRIEQSELQKLIDKYGDYDKALAHASAESLKKDLIDLRGGLDSAIGETYGYYRAIGESKYTSEGETFTTRGFIVTGDPELKQALLDAYAVISNLADGLGDGLELEFTTSNSTTLGGKNLYIYRYVPNDATATEESIYGDAAQVVHDYKVYQAILSALENAGLSDNTLYKETYKNYAAIKDNVESIIAYVEGINNNLASTAVFSAISEGGLPKTQEEFDTWRQELINTGSASGQFHGTIDTITQAIDNVLKQDSRFKEFFDSILTSTDAVVDKTLSSIQSLGSGFDRLDKIYADVYNKEDFDWGSIFNNKEFEDTFGGLGSAYDDFIATVANSPSDINACQNAFNNLASTYIVNSKALSEVTEESRNVAIAMLEQKGVANAAAIVDAQLAYNQEKLTHSTGEYVDMSYEQVMNLYAQADAGSVTKQVLAELAIAKLMVDDSKIDSSDDIDQLIALANAANASAASLANAAKAQSLFAQAEALDEDAKEYERMYNEAKSGAWGAEWKTALRQADELRQQAEELLNVPFEYTPLDPNKYKAKYKGSSATDSARKNAEKASTWFDKQLAEHQHLVAMEQESEAEYLAWLSAAYPKAYHEGIISLNDFYKYQEEVFKGLRDEFKDYLGDVEHEISMRESYEGESDAIIALYEQLMDDVAKEIADARAKGLDDTDDYIQELQSKWQGYYDSVKDIREEAEEGAKDAIDELIDYRIDMIKQDIENEKDALNKKLDYLREFYDEQKEMLQDQHDEEEYLEEQAEKRKSVSDIKAELAMLENDDSAWAQKRKLELQADLADAEKELGEFEDDHALDVALDVLDDAYKAQEAQIQAEMDALEEKLNDPEAVFNQALSDIVNNTGKLYYEMLAYNRQHGTGNDEDVNKTYEDAYKALLEYEDIFGEPYKGIILPNSTNYTPEEGSWDDSKISGGSSGQTSVGSTSGGSENKPSSSSTKPPSNGDTVKVKTSATHFGSKSNGVRMASFVPGGSYTVYQTSGNQVLIGRNGVYTGWVNLSDIEGYAGGTEHATAGLHRIDEIGSEYLFTSKDGNKYRVLNDGDKVLNARAATFLYEFANGGGEILEKIIKSAFGTSLFDRIQPTVVHNDITVGGVTVEGNADTRTVSEIRRAQRENLTEMLKSLNKLNK